MKGERSLIHFLSDCFYTYKPFLNLSEALFGLSDGLAYIYECVLYVRDQICNFLGGDKKGPKRHKITHCMEKRGPESPFLKIIKSTVYCEE